MDDAQVIVAALFVSVAGLNAIARWIAVPYPILLVIGGIVLGVMPGIPDVDLDPDLVLLLFLPPLLYAGAFFADLRALATDLRPISMLAIGLVLATTAVVAVLAHEVIGLSWAMAFALGAIVSPTDPVAATAVMRRLGAPRRIINITEGESLINDASALVVYKVAVAAAVGGSFSASHAVLEFAVKTAGGVAVGLVVARLVAEIRRRVDDTTIEVTISLLSGYAAFLPADRIGVSGVLAAVTCGIYMGWNAPSIASPEVRLQGFAMWEIVVFLLNATLFILIGLQLPVIVDGLHGIRAAELMRDGAVVCAAVIGTRLVWLMTMAYVVRALDRRPQQRERRVNWRLRLVGVWAGMRGAVCLAAALALPLRTDAGGPLPERDLVIFVAFAVILVTLIGQGLTLPALMRRLGVHEDGSDEEREEVRARLAAARAALERLDELELEEWTRDDTVERLRGLYTFRRRRFEVRVGKAEDEDIEQRSVAYQRLLHELYAVQRQAVVRMRNAGDISNDVMHRIERELDLEESRLDA